MENWFVMRAGPSNQDRHWYAVVDSEKVVDPFFSDDLQHEDTYTLKRAKKILRWALIHMGKLSKSKKIVKNVYWGDELIKHDHLCIIVYRILKGDSNRRGTSLTLCLKKIGGNTQDGVLTNRGWEFGT